MRRVYQRGPAACAVSLACEDDDADCDDGPGSRPRIFSSMQEVEEFWEAQARYVSAVTSLPLGDAHRLLRDHTYDADAAIKAHMLLVRRWTLGSHACARR